tara:strand:- start:74 stop:190 length:117 start_codon:yes stop_codon:yes gene_type:complete
VTIVIKNITANKIIIPDQFGENPSSRPFLPRKKDFIDT